MGRAPGMAQNSKGWLLWDPFTKKFLVSRDCKFMENLPYKEWKAENQAKIGVRLGEVKSNGLEHVELPLELSSSSTVTRQSPQMNGDEEEEEVQQGDGAEDESEECAFAFFSPVEMPGEPTNPKEAWEGPNGKEWKKASDEEMRSIIENDTFDFEVMLKLQDKFKCKTLGDVNYYLGLHIERDVEKRWMRVHQKKYLEALAVKFGKSEGHVATPLPSGFKCVKGPAEESVGEEKRHRFHSLVGSLMYAAVHTRPDAAFATGQLARVVQCPNEEQAAARERVAKYLGQTATVGLQYSAAAQRYQKGADGVEPGRLVLTAFSDASWASEPEDMTSVGGFICYVGGGPTAWETDMMTKRLVEQQHWKCCKLAGMALN
ncbi:hypothetical protein CLOP_g3130 [Closterium sp. NIES-67]|nr:hypothetical protein CLOP_g3130 [Closterium sp. NIES-67]